MRPGTQPVVIDDGFDPASPAFRADPYGALARLRTEGPAVIDGVRDLWYLVGSDAVQAGLSRIVRGHHRGPDRMQHFPGNPFAADGPGHTGPRRLIAPVFSNREVQRFRAVAQEIVDDVLSRFPRGGDLSVVDTLGFELPYQLTCDLLGIPDVDDREQLRRWTWHSLQLTDIFLSDAQLQEYLGSAAELAGHLAEVVEWKRQHLGDDLLSLVIRTADAREVMVPEQISPYLLTLYLAGMHTTVNQTALSLQTLLHHPAEWSRLLADPTLLDNAVEELLRYESTAQYMRRTAETEVDLGDVVVPAGAEVVCWIASANRDVARWGPEADRFDITRHDAKQHLAFGSGPHVCIGSWLARLELQVVVGTIAQRYPTSTVPDQDLVWESPFIRGPEQFIVRLAS